jgi:hypothetical protein
MNDIKIVKQFLDMSFLEHKAKMYVFDYQKVNATWHWGLGDDGELYCHGRLSKYGHYWEPWCKFSHCNIAVNFSDTCRIVKAFHHLRVFL